MEENNNKSKELTVKQKKFAEGLASGLSGPAAVKQAGYNVSNSNSASSLATKLKNNEDIQYYIRSISFEVNPEGYREGVARMFEIIQTGKPMEAINAFKTIVQLAGLEPKKVSRVEKLEATGKPEDFLKLPTE